MAAYLPGNHLLIDEVAHGEHDAELPEHLRSDLGRAQVACVLSLGVVRTIPWAARIVDGIALRTRVKLFSGFLNSTIHGILSAFSFGVASTLANEIGAVSGILACGEQEQYLAELSARAETRPHFWIEGAAVIMNAIYLTYMVIAIAPLLGI